MENGSSSRRQSPMTVNYIERNAPAVAEGSRGNGKVAPKKRLSHMGFRYLRYLLYLLERDNKSSRGWHPLAPKSARRKFWQKGSKGRGGSGNRCAIRVSWGATSKNR